MRVLCCPSCFKPLYRFVGEKLPAKGEVALSRDVRYMDGSPVYAGERVVSCCGKSLTPGMLRWKGMQDKELA